MAIRKILCCCGSGLGSSMLVRMNVEKALKNMEITGVDVSHSQVSDAVPGAADVFVVGGDLASFVSGLDNTIILNNIMDMNELTEKLKEKFANQ